MPHPSALPCPFPLQPRPSSFPTKYRSTCHGISAAWGKAGAIVGVYGFGTVNVSQPPRQGLRLAGACCLLSVLCTTVVRRVRSLRRLRWSAGQ